MMLAMTIAGSGCGDSRERAALKLYKATEAGDVVKVEAILKGRPELLNKMFKQTGFTPLSEAVADDQKAVVEALLAAGADLNAPNHDGSTPVTVALAQEKKEMFDLLLPKVELSRYGRKLLMEAATEPDTHYLKALLERKVDPNFVDPESKLSPLAWAHGNGSDENVLILIEGGADVNSPREGGWTALHRYSAWGNTKLMSLVLEHNARVDARSDDGRTPLHLAAELGQKKAVEILLNHRADVNARDNKGKTPLDYAMEKKQQEVVELLRKHGAIEK